MTDFDDEARIAAVLDRFYAPDAPLLGQGGEGQVYALSAEEVLKIYAASSRAYLEALANLHERLAAAALPFATPRILEIGEVAGIWYTRERRLTGRRWEDIVRRLTPTDMRRLLDQYLAALRFLHTMAFDDLPYGQALQLPGALTNTSWRAFLLASVEGVVRRSQADVERDVTNLHGKLSAFRALVERYVQEPPKRLVHGDYFPGNLLFNERLEISAVLDFSPHTVVGDAAMDVAGAVVFLDVAPFAHPAHTRYLRQRAMVSYGEAITPLLDLYTLYYSLYFSDTKRVDPTTYSWCVRHLNDASLWARLYL